MIVTTIESIENILPVTCRGMRSLVTIRETRGFSTTPTLQKHL
ncbi:hypothetical protein N9Z11_00255 [Mariniblastus sp.]|nr:hypothetical protein [Mariniblastus sp.]